METLPLPAFNCEAKVNNRLCLTLSFSSSFARTRICGRQFFVWGGPSSSRSNENLAAERASPRIPSPHSFSALMLNKFNVKIFRNLGKFKKVMNFMREIVKSVSTKIRSCDGLKVTNHRMKKNIWWRSWNKFLQFIFKFVRQQTVMWT